MPRQMKRNTRSQKNKPQDEENSLKKQVRDLMRNNEWVIIGADYCPACQEAKRFAKKNNLINAYLNIEDSVNKKAYQNYIHPIVMKSDPSWGTIPVIFQNGIFIGGKDDMIKIVNNQGKNVRMNTFRKFMSSGEIVVHKYIPEDFDY